MQRGNYSVRLEVLIEVLIKIKVFRFE